MGLTVDHCKMRMLPLQLSLSGAGEHSRPHGDAAGPGPDLNHGYMEVLGNQLEEEGQA